jgi:hypothetical protein
VVRFLKETKAGDNTAQILDDDRAIASGVEADKGQRSATRAGPTADSGSGLQIEKPDEGTGADVRRAATVSKYSGARDLNMEWLLLQRADPDAAAKIYAQAEK